jgi:hypothetical protein
MTLLVCCAVAGVVSAWAVDRLVERGERRRAFTRRLGAWWHPSSGVRRTDRPVRRPSAQAFGPHDLPPHEHRFGPAKPCWRAGSYEQHCVVPGCRLVRERRLDHVPAEPDAERTYQTRSMS